MTVVGSVSAEKVIEVVVNAGYGASVHDNSAKPKSFSPKQDTQENEFHTLKMRVISSIIILLFIMYFSMGYTMLGLPLPEFFVQNPLAIGMIQMISTAVVMVINQKFFINGFK